jgi:hypothetical protein
MPVTRQRNKDSPVVKGGQGKRVSKATRFDSMARVRAARRQVPQTLEDDEIGTLCHCLSTSSASFRLLLDESSHHHVFCTCTCTARHLWAMSHEGSMSRCRFVEHVLALALMDTLHKVCLVPANECRGQVDAMAFVEVLRDLVPYKSLRAAHVMALIVSAFEATLAHSSRGRPFYMLPDEGHNDK